MTPHQMDAPSLIAAIPDIMAAVRVSEAARAAGIPFRLVEADDWTTVLAGVPRPVGAVVDLTAAGSIDRIKRAVAAAVPVLAYGPHVDADTLSAARLAGAARVVPRGQMMQHAAEQLAHLWAERRMPPSVIAEDDDAPVA